MKLMFKYIVWLVCSEVVAVTSNASVEYGQTTVLVCVGYGEPSVSVSWWRGDSQITNTSRVFITEELMSQGGRLFQLSYLQICAVETSDDGIYSCTVNNGSASSSHDTVLSVTSTIVICSGHKHVGVEKYF